MNRLNLPYVDAASLRFSIGNVGRSEGVVVVRLFVQSKLGVIGFSALIINSFYVADSVTAHPA